MRNTTALRFITGAGFGVGIARKVHPRRDPEGHPNGGAGGDGGAPKPKVLTDAEAAELKIQQAKDEAAAAVKTAQDQAAWLVAEQAHQLKLAQDATKTQEEKDRDAKIEAAVAEVLPTRVAEATAPLLTQIDTLRLALVDKSIDAELAGRQLSRDKVSGIIATLDMKKFLKEDGSVNEEVVKSWASGLTAATETRPPRGNRSNVGLDDDRGFGRYLKKNQT